MSLSCITLTWKAVAAHGLISKFSSSGYRTCWQSSHLSMTQQRWDESEAIGGFYIRADAVQCAKCCPLQFGSCPRIVRARCRVLSFRFISQLVHSRLKSKLSTKVCTFIHALVYTAKLHHSSFTHQREFKNIYPAMIWSIFQHFYILRCF